MERRPIPGYEEFYTITRTGEVRRGGKARTPQMKNGYLYLLLHRPDRQPTHKTHYIHQLIWETYKGPIPKGLEINHKDGIKTRNRLGNFELITHQENVEHARRVLDAFVKGEDHPNSKLTNEEACQMREQRWNGVACPELARRFGVTRMRAYEIVTGKAYKNAPGPITPTGRILRKPRDLPEGQH